MPSPEPTTLRLLLYWSYANLAMASAAVHKGANKYVVVHYMIRAKLYKGLHTGTMSICSLMDDERDKMNGPRMSAYCGGDGRLTIDHLFASSVGGLESADNSVWACRSCNSSKGARDMLGWWPKRHDDFPPLRLLRRYLKLALLAGEAAGALDTPLTELGELPFEHTHIPTKYPKPSECRL